jgi:hypothetical protein
MQMICGGVVDNTMNGDVMYVLSLLSSLDLPLPSLN